MKIDNLGALFGAGMLVGAYVAGKIRGRKDAFGDVHRVLLESIVDAKEKEMKEAKES